jgi:hypothetical protein
METSENGAIEKEVVGTGIEVVETIETVPVVVGESQSGGLFRVVLISIISAVVVAGIVFFGIYFWSTNKSKTPDLVITAPKIKETVVEDSPYANLPIYDSTVGAVLADMPYRDLGGGFEIISPAGWYVDSSKKTGSAVVILKPEITTLKDNIFATFISVTVGETGNVALADQVDIVKKNILETYPSYQIEDNKETYLQGRVFYLIGGYYTVDETRIRNRIMMTIYNGRGYAVSATGPDKSWSENELNIVVSMNSFKFI